MAGTGTGARITGSQVRAARGFLRWTIAELARAADVGISTVQAIERVDGEAAAAEVGLETTRIYRDAARAESLGKIAKAFEAAGITFLADDGKRGPGLRAKVTT